MKKWLFIVSILIVSLCSNVNAAEYQGTLVAETVKYYKTVTNNGGVSTLSRGSNNSNSISYEVTEEEYNNAPTISTLSDGFVETTYKKMTTSIYSYGASYRYKTKLHWKNMPSTRSYDIIACGFPSSVKSLVPYSEYKYCKGSNNCTTETANMYFYQGEHGVGVVLGLVVGSNVTSMDETLYFTVNKNTTSTIVRQYAYGDYAHATKTISLTNAKKFTVGSAGILHNANYVTYYDDIPTANATWAGSW